MPTSCSVTLKTAELKNKQQQNVRNRAIITASFCDVLIVENLARKFLISSSHMIVI